MTLVKNWHTKQVDYTNNFLQAEVQEDICIDLPKSFGSTDQINKVLKLLESIYGLK